MSRYPTRVAAGRTWRVVTGVEARTLGGLDPVVGPGAAGPGWAGAGPESCAPSMSDPPGLADPSGKILG